MKEQQTKYLELFSMIGYFIGFPILLYYSLTRVHHFLIVIALIFIFAFRFIGYGIDRYQDKKR